MAQFLTIYNPELDESGLDESEEGIAKQVVFYGSKIKTSQDEILRHVGLIQGVVELSRGFSGGKSLSHLDTSNLRIIAAELEDNQTWWIAAGVSLDCTDSDPISPPQVLISDLKGAYYRWRLHYGPIEDRFNAVKRDEFELNLSKWWTAFFTNWNTRINGSGIKNIFISKTLTAKGELQDVTVDAIQAVVGREPGIRDMIIVLQGADKVEYEGCIWTGTGNLSAESTADLVNWIGECCRCPEKEWAFLEPSGYVRHLMGRQEIDEQPEYNETTPLFKGALSSISNASHTAYGQMIRFGSKLTLRSISGTPIEQSRSDLEDSAPSNDLTGSSYVIGWKGKLNEDDAERESFTNNSEQLDPVTASSDTSDTITRKQLFLSLKSSPRSYQKYNIVVYERNPFIFVGIYALDEPSLSQQSYYKSLHLRLASLSEPIYNDLNTFASQHSEKSRDFYYLVIDSSKNSIKSSLPEISSEPVRETSDLENSASDHQQIIHLHLSIGSLLTTFDYEQEKFLRTSRNWWIYWSKLKDGRLVIFTRKWSNHQKAQTSANSLLGALGQEGKAWLEEYKEHGRV